MSGATPSGRLAAVARRSPVVIFGGAGFIGTNLADRLASSGEQVILFDNLSRSGVELNGRWLRQVHGERVRLDGGDVRDREAVARAVRGAGFVYHLAAQVAVTTSLSRPREDFEINALGTLNVLEAVRACDAPPGMLFTSTNKVYGALEDLQVEVRGSRYEPADETVRRRGVDESRSLDFHGPYGCSKGAADQYVLDYARSFGLRSAVFRMSCIYGPHQFGTEDQGWVAHFLVRSLAGEPVAIYGDGLQVRDILFVDDLVDALLLGRERLDRVAGRAFNIGGGPDRAVSLLELLRLIGRIRGRLPRHFFESWRTGDQRYYVSDTSAFGAATGWRPRVGVTEGVGRLEEWLAQSDTLRPGLVAEAGRQ